MTWVRDFVANGGTLMFVGTKKQAQETIEEEARRCGMPFVNRRWMGGMLTNFQTILNRIKRLEQLEQMRDDGDIDRLPKKEGIKMMDELERLDRLLGGMKKQYRTPQAIFVVDPHREQIAIAEARRSEINIVAMVDTNCNPDQIDYPIPANDDAIRAIRLLCTLVADAAIEGAQERASRAVEPEIELPEEPTYDDVEATDELVAALAGGAALSFAPDDDDDLLPGGPVAAPPAEDGATPEEIAAELAREAAEKEADRDATPA